MRRLLVLSLPAMLLVGCSKPAQPPSGPSSPAQIPPAAATPAAREAEGPAKHATAALPVGLVLPQLAYSYALQIEAPAEGVDALLAKDEAACRQAGPATCQIVGAQRARAEGEGVHATLTLRAEPGWLSRFRASMGDEAKAVHGKLAGSETKTEDLTRTLVDTEAGIRARTLLQTRLEQLLANRQGKLSDLLDVERELARVQGEIDAAKSELAVMRARVSTAELTIAYDSRAPLATTGAWRPLREAVRNTSAVFATSLGALIMLVAAFAPFSIIAVAAVILFRAFRRRRASLIPPAAVVSRVPPGS